MGEATATYLGLDFASFLPILNGYQDLYDPSSSNDIKVQAAKFARTI